MLVEHLAVRSQGEKLRNSFPKADQAQYLLMLIPPRKKHQTSNSFKV